MSTSTVELRGVANRHVEQLEGVGRHAHPDRTPASALRGQLRAVRRILLGMDPKHLEQSRTQVRDRNVKGTAVAVLGAAASAAAVAALVGVLVPAFLLRGFTVPSESMEPTLTVGDYLFVSVPGRYDVHRGDVVVFSDPSDWAPGDFVVKRVIGLPGDVVTLTSSGRLAVNGHMVDEPYLGTATADPEALRVVVPDGHVWVMGDNRAVSADSRRHGPVELTAVVGTVFASWGTGLEEVTGRDWFESVPPFAGTR